MDRYWIPVDLVRTARMVVDMVSRNAGENASPVHSALLASQLYEAIKLELRRTPRREAARVGMLSAALDQCRNAAVHVDRPALMTGELSAALEMLETALAEGERSRSRFGEKPRLTLIEGGLSATGTR